jgi:hypothetical protein
MLRKQLKDDNHEDWEDLIDPLLFAYRNSIHSFFLTACVNRCPIHHYKFIEAINFKEILVGIEIKTREDRNKFSSWV